MCGEVWRYVTPVPDLALEIPDAVETRIACSTATAVRGTWHRDDVHMPLWYVVSLRSLYFFAGKASRSANWRAASTHNLNAY